MAFLQIFVSQQLLFLFSKTSECNIECDGLWDQLNRSLPPESTLKVPKNVLLKSFLPQQDILAHKNTILFITHCGMHGVMESIYHEVPMVGMPVAFDQGDVLTRIEEKGIGIGISKWASSDIIVNAVKTVLNDTRYDFKFMKIHI